MPWRKPYRFWRHLVTDQLSARRAFPRQVLDAIQAAIEAGERVHRGQLQFVVEDSLPLARIAAKLSPRERALEVFGLQRAWDTADNAGVLVYVLLADRAVEIIADRGISSRVAPGEWASVCREMEEAFRRGQFAEGALAGIARINTLLGAHFPRRAGDPGNELPDRPVLL